MHVSYPSHSHPEPTDPGPLLTSVRPSPALHLPQTSFQLLYRQTQLGPWWLSLPSTLVTPAQAGNLLQDLAQAALAPAFGLQYL